MKEEREEEKAGRQEVNLFLAGSRANKYRIKLHKIPEITIWQLPRKKSFRQESVIIDIANDDVFLYTEI